MTAPIAEAMRNYDSDLALAFHTPGHKQGLGAHELLRELITDAGLRREVSLMEELDDLHSPRGCIDEAQKLAAELWHADEAIFFVNGTTSAVQTMLLSILQPNDRVLIPRNAHRCVMNGLILSGAKPIFLSPEFDPDFGIALNISVETIKAAVKKYPNTRALLLTSPNYYGVAADLKSISELAHQKNMLLLIDEAHGVHLQFSDRLPPSAMDSGADMSAQSTHKLLGSVTQTSMLMLNSARIDVDRVRRVASMLQSTSPNYLLLASLDIARLQMQSEGNRLLERAIDLAEFARKSIAAIDGLRVFDRAANFDPTKVTVNVSELGLTGLEAEQILRHELKIQCELSDANNVLFLITYADTQREIARLLDALKKLASIKKSARLSIKKFSSPPAIIEPGMTPREAFYAPTTAVKLRDAIGKICGEEVTFYPPGIPLLCPGELITSEIAESIEENLSIGRRIVAAADLRLHSIKIIP